MENELKIFQNAEFGEIRTVIRDGEPWFVVVDVCKAFGDTDHKRSVGRIDEDEKMLVPITDSFGRTQKAMAVNEAGLYSLLFGFQPQKGRKGEGAHNDPHVQERINALKAFKRWVTHEVIPAIRKHGAYTMPGMESKFVIPQTLPEALRLAANLAEQCQVLNTEDNVLSQQILRWDNASFINAAVRKYATCLHPKFSDQFTFAWNCFKKELLYRYGINLKMRKTEYLNRAGKKTSPKISDLLSKEEIPLAVSTIVAMCREASVDISDLLKNINSDELVS